MANESRKTKGAANRTKRSAGSQQRRVTPPPNGYKANFLWPHAYESVEAMGWEFANANTEAYRKLVWRELLKRAKAKAV